MSDTPPALRKPIPRWLRLRVGPFMVLVLLIGGGLGWYLHSVRVQRDAVEVIRKAGGYVAYGWEVWAMERGQPVVPPPWPRWLDRSLGPDYFDPIVHVQVFDPVPAQHNGLVQKIGQLTSLEGLDLSGCVFITDESLREIGSLTRLRGLALSDCPIRGPGLRYLENLRQLEVLHLKSIAPGDNDLASLGRLTSLKELSLAGKRLTHEGLLHLARLKNLEKLTICDTNEVSNDALSTLGRLRPLRHLILEGGSLRGGRYDVLAGLERLEYLFISDPKAKRLVGLSRLPALSTIDALGSEVGDDALQDLAGAPALEYLELYNTKVTDAGLPALLKLPALKFVDLGGTAVTDAGLKTIEQLKGKVKIELSGSKVIPGVALEWGQVGNGSQ